MREEQFSYAQNESIELSYENLRFNQGIFAIFLRYKCNPVASPATVAGDCHKQSVIPVSFDF